MIDGCEVGSTAALARTVPNVTPQTLSLYGKISVSLADAHVKHMNGEGTKNVFAAMNDLGLLPQ